jgi:hypothetical protein
MDEKEYRAKCEEVLGKELPVESPDELMKAVVEVEALGYLATKFQATSERKLREAEVMMMNERAKAYNEVEGKTAPERQAKVDAMTSELAGQIAMLESLVKYYRNISILIDRRAGLSQSILSNFSAQIKAGIIAR